MKLTKSEIDKTTYVGANGSRHVLWDSEIPGLGVRFFPSGKKALVLSYRVDKRKRLITLGRWGVLTLEEARKQARIKIGQISQGIDPHVTHGSAKVGRTMNELCDEFYKRHALKSKISHKQDKRRIDKDIKPAIGSLLVSQIERHHIERLHETIGERTKYEANRTLSLLGTMFRLAAEWKYELAGGKNPARGIKKFTEKSRDRWITPEEMPAIAHAIDEDSNIYARAALWLYLLTGVRKSELLKLKWTDIDFFRREMRLEHTKNGNTHYVPLSKEAIAILKDIPRQNGNPFVICGHVKGKALVNISKPWNRVKARANVSDVRLHDLRRTVGSWLAQRGSTLHLIGKVLNHKHSDTTKIYARFQQDDMRSALENYGDSLLSIVSKPNEPDESTA